MSALNRRYDIDWLRVIAIGLLLIYHVAIGFQSWGIMIGFITTKEPWVALWTPMPMLNVWRIPLLFFVSGMGVYFAMQQRSWKELIAERVSRILVPFVFGTFAIVPLHILIWRYYYKMDLRYTWSPGHLWFLGNIFVYVLVLSPVLFYLKKKEHGVGMHRIKKVLSHPIGLLLVAGMLMLEVAIVKPVPFELYAMTGHGFFFGLLAFFFGFCFVWSGFSFWQMIQRRRLVWVTLAVGLFLLRILYWKMNTPGYAIAVESLAWILTVLAFGSKYLNKPGRTLTYLSQAAYPVYILHMIFLYLASLLIFPLPLPNPLRFLLVLVFTIAGCMRAYELIRRTKLLRPLFGLRME
jgi:glucans biosynthesis protein C